MRLGISFFVVQSALCSASTSLYEGKTTSVVEFDAKSFTETVKKDATGSSFWIVVFYAHWCGHCQYFAPEYIKIAESLSKNHGHLKFGAIDCANPDLRQSDACSGFNIKAFPTVLAFKRGGKLAELAKTPEDLKMDIQRLLDGKPIEEVKNASEVPVENLPAPVPSEEDRKESENLVINPDTVMADARLTVYTILISEVFKGNTEILSETESQDLKNFLKLCSHLFRDGPCESILASISPQVPQKKEWNALVDSYYKDTVNERYLSCKDFSCGMWRLLHLISVSHWLDAAKSMESIRFVVANYFSCETCRKHFLKDYHNCDFGRCAGTLDKLLVGSWLVRVHNAVNLRLQHPAWPDDSPREPIEYVNEVRALYGMDPMIIEASSNLLIYLFIISLVALVLLVAVSRSTDLLDKIKYSLTKKYQPMNIV